MILQTIHRIPFFRKIISPILDSWIQNKVHTFSKFLVPDKKILDLGSGNCLVANHLINQGHNIVAADVNFRLKPILLTPFYY